MWNGTTFNFSLHFPDLTNEVEHLIMCPSFLLNEMLVHDLCTFFCGIVWFFFYWFRKVFFFKYTLDTNNFLVICSPNIFPWYLFCNPMDWSTPDFPVHHQLLELAQTHVHRVGDAIQPSHPPSPLLLLPSVFPSIRVFSNESVLLIGWPKYWSFSFSISPSNEYSGPISFSFIELLKYILLSDRARLPFPQHRTFCLPTILPQQFLVMLLFPFPISQIRGKKGPTLQRRFPNSCGTRPSPTCWQPGVGICFLVVYRNANITI